STPSRLRPSLTPWSTSGSFARRRTARSCAQPTPSGRFITQGLRSVEDAPGVSRALRAGSAFGLAAAAAALACAAVVSATTLQVPAGGDLQSALFNAQPGDTIVLTPGATYTGNFTLPDKGGSSLITLQTDPQGLPGAGERISPAEA